ncbi:methyltransferase domain-containing protein [Dactylosporangium sp. NBC_01737]|uniref:class I SAM-dependent methyltransferase n=1 Tax=Dactylosporangium sp. NBC_01737 TaxID=2975959 RepID=UPI002E130E99|nr:methyltransferase domain-containing protein [Dactylosporangium sp. NBC_01737]
MTGDRARVFGAVADEYDRIRPGYPTALIDDVLAYAGPGGAPALDVGAGTGRATVAFAERGVAVTAVEPDEAMAAVLARRVAGHPDVTVEVAAFEDYAPRQPFGLPGGALALFWNGHRPADPDTLAAIVAAHRTHAPGIDTAVEIDPEPTTEAELAVSWPRTELDLLPQFGELSERLYRWERKLSTVDYVAYLSTKSANRMLTERTRADLFGAIVDSAGPYVTLSMETLLYLARRR